MGFAQTAFTPSYGLAETTLAATFSPRGQGLKKHTIDMGRYERTSEAIEATELTPAEQQRTFVACGPALPEHEIEIRDFDGKILGEKMVGQVCLRGPSVSPGYFRIYSAVTAAIRLEVGVPVKLMLVPRSTMIVTSSGKLSRARVKNKFEAGQIIDLLDETPMKIVKSDAR